MDLTGTTNLIGTHDVPSTPSTQGHDSWRTIPSSSTTPMTPGCSRHGARRIDLRDRRPSTPPPPRLSSTEAGWARQPPVEYSPASDDVDDTRQSYAAALACPPGHTNNPRTPPAALLTPLRGTPSLRPHTTLRQINLAGWTLNWDDGATDTNESKNMDLGITGPEAPRWDPAPTVDNATAAAHTAGDTASLDSGSPPPPVP